MPFKHAQELREHGFTGVNRDRDKRAEEPIYVIHVFQVRGPMTYVSPGYAPAGKSANPAWSR